MKGLLLKDLYMTVKYCKAYLLIVVVFIAVPFTGNDNLFFIFYPLLLSGMIPATLLSYDEKSKWGSYCGTLPYRKSQLVSAKYLIGLISQIFVLLLTAVAQAIKMNMDHTFVLNQYLVLIGILLILSCLLPSSSLPFIFKLGVEKGRIAYFFMVGIFCAGSAVASQIFMDKLHNAVSFKGSFALVCLAAIAVYALSWYLSIVFYRKREAK